MKRRSTSGFYSSVESGGIGSHLSDSSVGSVNENFLLRGGGVINGAGGGRGHILWGRRFRQVFLCPGKSRGWSMTLATERRGDLQNTVRVATGSIPRFVYDRAKCYLAPGEPFWNGMLDLRQVDLMICLLSSEINHKKDLGIG